MDFEWDESKNETNIDRHDLDFADARQIFDAPMLVGIDNRKDYGEERFVGIGIEKSYGRHRFHRTSRRFASFRYAKH